MGTDLVNSVWHLCSPWISGLGSEALQWETQLQFFNEHLTTLDSMTLFLALLQAVCFVLGISLGLSVVLSQKAGISVLFYEPLGGSGEVGVDSPV